jgi:hypothetical protein
MSAAVDSSNRYGVRRMKATGMVTIEDLMVTRPMSVREALNLSAWLFCLADPESAKAMARNVAGEGFPEKVLTEWERLVCAIAKEPQEWEREAPPK